MNKTKGIITNVLILCGVAALLIFTQSCGTVSGFGPDINDVSAWSNDNIHTSDAAEVLSYETDTI